MTEPAPTLPALGYCVGCTAGPSDRPVPRHRPLLAARADGTRQGRVVGVLTTTKENEMRVTCNECGAEVTSAEVTFPDDEVDWMRGEPPRAARRAAIPGLLSPCGHYSLVTFHEVTATLPQR